MFNFRQNRDDFKQLTTGDVSSLTESEFNSNLPTKIYIHGFVMNGYSHPQVLTMRDGMSVNIYIFFHG